MSVVTNIDDYRKYFVNVPTKLISNPKNEKDYLNNLYYKFGSMFKAFSKEDIMDIFSPEHFYYSPKDMNLFIDICADDRFFYNPEYNPDKIDSSIWNISEHKYTNPTVNYNFNTGQILLTLNDRNDFHHNRERICKVFDYDINFYEKYLNYNNLLDWREFKSKAISLVNKAIDTIKNSEFYIVNKFSWSKGDKDNKYSIDSFDILETLEVRAGIIVDLTYKVFSASQNKLDYRTEYYSKEYIFKDGFNYIPLCTNPEYVIGYDTEFVKNCVAYYKKRKIQYEIDDINLYVKKSIKELEAEQKKLEKQLEDNQPKIKSLTKKKNSIKGTNIKLNLK